MKKLILVCAALLAFFIALPASAAPAPVTGTIVLDQPSPTLGSSVTFTTTITGLKKNQDPGILVTCSQNGTPVYEYGAGLGTTWVLAGPDWIASNGTARCKAELYYVQQKPELLRQRLAVILFDVSP